MSAEVARLQRLADYLARFDPAAVWIVSDARDRYGKLGLVKTPRRAGREERT